MAVGLVLRLRGRLLLLLLLLSMLWVGRRRVGRRRGERVKTSTAGVGVTVEVVWFVGLGVVGSLAAVTGFIRAKRALL